MTEKNYRQRLRWQMRLGLVILIISVIISYYLKASFSVQFLYAWVFGLTVGFILQRSKICFVAALRDPFLFGLTELTRAIILALVIASLGFAAIQYYQQINGLMISGKLISIGWHIPIGAFIFGLGAALGGGCASGTLMRLGEGFQLQWVVLLGYILGTMQGTHDAGWWYSLANDNLTVHLPTLIGELPAVGLQLFLLGVLYLLCWLWEKYKFSS